MIDFCKIIRSLFKKIDLFGISFSFKYKSEEKYGSTFGGIITSILFILWLLSFAKNFIPFYSKKNYSLQYYAINAEKDEQIKIKLAESSTDFAFGLRCDNKNITEKANDLFKLEIEFYNKTHKNGDNSTVRTINKFSTHNCTFFEDFNNTNNTINEELFNGLEINELQCMDIIAKNETIEGIYTDEIFTYYALTVSSKEDNEEHYNKINDFLFQNDCKLQFYYKDIITNLSNYKNPIKPFINSLFLQINPHLYIKKNIFFMNYKFENQDSFLKSFENKATLKHTGYSRVEEYFLYKGLNRSLNKAFEHEKYAKLFIRADNKLIEIKREYQDFLEFYADATSLIEDIFIVFHFIINYINSIRAKRSVIKKLFFEDTSHYKFNDLKKKELNISTETSIPKATDNEILDEITINTNNSNDEKKIMNSRVCHIYIKVKTLEKIII
jgi:hypothetical protein